MKNRFLVAIVLIAMLLVTLCGCSQLNENEPDESQPRNNTQQTEEDNAHHTLDPHLSISYRPEPLTIQVNNNNRLKGEIVSHIDMSETMSGGENNHLYYVHRISDMPQFYNLDNLKIDGYKMHHVNITKGSFVFVFVPIDEFNNENVASLGMNNISIAINRWEWFDEHTAANPMKDSIAQAEQQGWGRVTDDGFLFGNGLQAPLGNTIFTIRAPFEDNYDLMRDLAHQVIATTELVNINTN